MAAFLVSRASMSAGHVAACIHVHPCFLLTRVRPVPLKQPEQACRDVRDIRREAGRREIEPEYDAHRGVQYSQARIPAQDEYRCAQCQRCRERYRQGHHLLPLFAVSRAGRLSDAGTARHLAAHPARPEHALLARARAVCGQRTTRALPPTAAPVQLVPHAYHLLSPLVSFR